MSRVLLAVCLSLVPSALAAQAGDSLATAAGAAAALPAASAPARPSPFAWTADRRSYRVGDVITVLVDESTLAIRDRSESRAQERDTRLELDGSFSSGTTSSGGKGDFRSGSAGSSSERGQARRQDRLTAELTVRVTALEPGGMLRVQGSKALVIDGREQKVTLTGFVRPADVSPHNVIDSWRIADASIAYTTDGKLSQPKRGIIARVLGMIWP